MSKDEGGYLTVSSVYKKDAQLDEVAEALSSAIARHIADYPEKYLYTEDHKEDSSLRWYAISLLIIPRTQPQGDK